jgi:hypothetical protein
MSAGRLIASVLLGPIVWLACLELLFALVPWACHHSRTPARYLIPAIGVAAMVAAAGAMRLAWRAWREVGADPPAAALPEARTRLLALAGLGSGALFVLAALAAIIPALVLGPCD